MRAGGYQSGDVRNIGKEIGTDFIGDFAEFLEIKSAGIGGGAGDYDLRAFLFGKFPYGIVINQSVAPSSY